MGNGVRTEANRTRRNWRKRWLLLAAVCFGLGLANLGGYRPLTNHEVLVAQTAREMLQADEWILPRYFGEPRLQKPPLAYWLCILSYRATGSISEFSARLPSVLAGMVYVGAVCWLATSWFGRRAGWTAGFLTVTSVYFIQQSRLAEADVTLAATTALAMTAYGLAFTGRLSTQIAGAAFWSALGLSVLAKGPIGVAMAAVAILAHGCLCRSAYGLRIVGSFAGIALFLALCLAWPAAVLQYASEAAHVWYRETIGRMVRDPNDVQRHAFYYPLAALWLTLPWTGLWLAEFWRWRKRSRWDAKRMFLICWLAFPMLLLSCSSGKQEHYLIPALAPCTIAAALSARRFQRRSLGRRMLCAAIAVLTVGCVLTLQYLILPRVHGRRGAAEWVQRQAAVAPNERVVALGHSVQWLVFYFPQPMQRVDSLEAFFAGLDEQAVGVLATKELVVPLQQHCHLESLAACPPTAGLSDGKLPVLLRVRGKAD